VGRSDRGGIKALSKPFSKLLQKSRVLLQTFPNKALAVLWDFKGLQGFQTSFDGVQIFHLRPPFSAAFWTPRDRIPCIAPHGASSASGVRLILRCVFVDDAFIAGAAIQIKRIFNLTDNPIFGKKYRQFFRRTNRLHYLSFSVRSDLGKPIE
jgi:hypothetical protein